MSKMCGQERKEIRKRVVCTSPRGWMWLGCTSATLVESEATGWLIGIIYLIGMHNVFFRQSVNFMDSK